MIKNFFFFILVLAPVFVFGEENSDNMNATTRDNFQQAIILENPRTHRPSRCIKNDNPVTLHLHQQLIVEFNNSRLYCGVWPCGYPIYDPPRVNAGIDPVTTWNFQSSSNKAVLVNEADQEQFSEGQHRFVFDAASLGVTMLTFHLDGHFVNRNGYFYQEDRSSWCGPIFVTVTVSE